MARNFFVHGRRLDSPHSPARESRLSVVHVGVQPDIDYESEARSLILWLTEVLPPGTMQSMDLNRDLLRELERMRTVNEELTARLNERMTA